MKKAASHNGVGQPTLLRSLTVKTTVCPNFISKELREAYKTEDPMEVAKRVLSVSGEYDNWLNKATENDLKET
ncbi:phage tail assembly chaperone [Bacillus halotolerans]|uniref:phage tail assembly chaperone n=1 Tax=Bacillus halotolerans TaxID=260554 RepID=UPI00403F4AF5